MTHEAHRAAERAARASFGRLVALLASTNGDLALAEDAVAGALEQALVSWPTSGVPDNPEGWLLTVARNRQRDLWKSSAHRTSVVWDEALGSNAPQPPEDPFARLDPDAIGDRRLELLFACAHPAIDAAIRTPLMLQCVLGFDAAQIGAAYGLPPATVAQRLVRAKRRIRDAGIPFVVPGREALPARLANVLEAVYGCYAIAWHDADGGRQHEPSSFAGEALHLAVTLAAALDDQPEAWALAALIALSLSRAHGRGEVFVPLDEQDPRQWDAALIDEGIGYLGRADAAGHRPGRFRLEAAMQAVHADRLRTGTTDWAALEVLSGALQTVAPTLGGAVAHAAIVGRTEGPLEGLAQLDALDGVDRLAAFHATRGDLLVRVGGRDGEAARALRRAAELVDDAPSRTYLLGRAERLA